ncbi:hypothetical protein [Hymenobacter armeniacus]|uniref:Outer membrane protein beta-barrel domain-containing protein n=1 Tax=Hymenobacter armeniacus TaxID=2771358 RepID=A0ABR8JUK4_9BACT|nr:hypothetical protein [Hymenobacter armeniacus]MBD2722260.1 hypothetical protein [Hymenobacter armeniacus]
MLRRLLPLFAAFFGFIFQGRAQAYEPGLLVRATGDTLRGEIENGFWLEPPAFIRFRAAAGAPSQLFQPRQLRAVVFAQGRYFRYELLPLNHAAETNLAKLPRGNYFDVKQDSLLAEVLVDGPAGLQRVVQPGAVHYYVSAPGQPVLELSDRKYLRMNQNGSWEVADGNNYRNLLALYFGPCPAAAQAAERAPFTAAGLAAVVQAYNATCSPAKQAGRSWLATAKPRRRMSLQGGVLAGARYNRIENMTGFTDGACVDCRVRPFGGLYAELFQPSRTAAVYGELSLSPYSNQLLYYNGYSSSGTQYFAVDYWALLGTARLGLRFYFPLPREKQFMLGMGYELNSIIRARVNSTGTALPNDLGTKDLYAAPTILPNLTLGWRSGRTTISADGQSYRNNAGSFDLFSNLVGSNYALRLALAYRLGRNHDAPAPRPTGGN